MRKTIATIKLQLVTLNFDNFAVKVARVNVVHTANLKSIRLYNVEHINRLTDRRTDVPRLMRSPGTPRNNLSLVHQAIRRLLASATAPN